MVLQKAASGLKIAVELENGWAWRGFIWLGRDLSWGLRSGSPDSRLLGAFPTTLQDRGKLVQGPSGFCSKTL